VIKKQIFHIKIQNIFKEYIIFGFNKVFLSGEVQQQHWWQQQQQQHQQQQHNGGNYGRDKGTGNR